MHRSYTSLLSCWLHKNGIHMQADRSDPVNAALCEDEEILQLHMQFLHANGMNWLNAHAPFTDEGDHYQKAANAIWSAREKAGKLWGWKDPRTALLFPYLWSEHLSGVRFVFLYRDPLAVANSLFHREVKRRTDGKSFARSRVIRFRFHRSKARHLNCYLRIWITYNLSCLHLVKSVDPAHVLILKSEELVQSEPLIRTQITNAWGVPLGPHSLSDLLIPAPHRHPVNVPDIRGPLLNEARDFYQSLGAFHDEWAASAPNRNALIN